MAEKFKQMKQISLNGYRTSERDKKSKTAIKIIYPMLDAHHLEKLGFRERLKSFDKTNIIPVSNLVNSINFLLIGSRNLRVVPLE